MKAPDRLLLASENRNKRAELARLLEPLGVGVLTPAEVGGLPEVEEDRETFAGNAAKKAVSAAGARGLWALADDSGLEVDRLGGAPGVSSARFAGRHGDNEGNNDLLLEKLAGVPDGERGARFVCALALADPEGRIVLEVEGTVRGRILHARRGTGGFGYDPLFELAEPGEELNGLSFGELTPGQKASVSHRARALRGFVRRLALATPASSE